MNDKSIIRIWQELDVKAIAPHLFIAGNTTGDCGNCKEMGISFDAKNCPKCGTLFKYMGSRISNSSKEAKRLRGKRPDLILIEFNDFKEAQARTKARGLFVFLIFLLLFSNIQAANPIYAISPDDIILISTDKEISMGASIAKEVEEKYDEVDDPLIQSRFEEIGNRLAAVCDRQDLIYHFKVLKAKGDKEEYFNAFALPGGYVYMFDAMIEILKDDDKIAAVTAHELGHIGARHAVNRLQSSLGINALMILALAAARDGRTIAKANEALTQLMMAYSREDELEADMLSVEYVKKAGFDSDGVLESLLTLKRLRKKGPERRYTHYKSHPYLSERIAAVRREIKGYTDFDSYINLPEKEEDF